MVLQTFYKNKLKESRIGKDKSDSYVEHCIPDPDLTGLKYLEVDDNTYDIDFGGGRAGHKASWGDVERLNHLKNTKNIPNIKLEGSDISLANSINNIVKTLYDIPDFDDDTSLGCSKVDISGMSVEDRENLKFNTTNIKLKLDGTTYEILHRDKIQILYNNLFDDPNRILVFFKVLLITVIVLFIYSIIGVCFEFWIRYGYAPECLYYRNNCNTINKKLSVIDYVFPREICDYPYQRCNPTNKFKEGLKGGLKGGTKGGTKEEPNGFVSSFTEYKAANAKCINAYTETIFAGRPIPYNIADYVEDNFSSELVRSLGKTISFTFLYYVLASRKALNLILSNTSKFYQKGKGNFILGNIVFLILSGLIFGLIAAFSKDANALAGAGWPFAFIFAILGLVSAITTLFVVFNYIIKFGEFLFYSARSWFGFEDDKKRRLQDYLMKFLKNKSNSDKCPFNTDEYYVLINDDKFFFSIPKAVYSEPKGWLKFLGYFFANIIIFIFWFAWRLAILPFVMFTMSMISMLYLYIVIPLKIFYVPLSNPLETFSLLKDHADLLVIFLCLGILSACKTAFNDKVTGIVGGFIAILIIIKVSKGLSKLGL